MRKIIFDYEAESLNLGLARPWQLAWRIEEDGKVIDRKERWIDIHDLYVSEGAARVTHFTYEKWESRKVPAKDVVEEIEEDFFGDPETMLVGHNILGYDVYIKKNLYSYVGKPLRFDRFMLRCRDTLAIARARWLQLEAPEQRTHQFILWQYRMLNAHQKGMKTKLSDLCNEFGIPFDETKTHDALYDVDLNSKVDDKLLYALDLS